MRSLVESTLRIAIIVSATMSTALAQDGVQGGAAKSSDLYGHSSHGSSFDEGPRQRPWKIDGIGEAPFPITTNHPEVQEWFNQGNALLHSFWYREAERAFRWCIKLDPDCAMAYWALSRSVPYERERSRDFLNQAIKRKHHVSHRERLYIEAWENAFIPSLKREQIARPGWNATSPQIAKELEKIILEFPDDIEAKSLYVLNCLFSSGRYALETVLQEILEVAPEHPGAVHYRIHNWDSMELGHFALDSCADYGRIASRVGHANHMPGHIYTKLGMWHEGAIWLDSATRVEKAYMQESLTLPYQAWNYAHNRNFLAHAQSMLGLPTPALQGAYDMLNSPKDPKYNRDEGGYSVFSQGMSALRRTLVRFERWESILEPDHIPWGDRLPDRLWKTYCETLAYIGLDRLPEAESHVIKLRELESELKAAPPPSSGNPKNESDRENMMRSFELEQSKGLHPIMLGEAEGQLWLALGDSIKAIGRLSEAAELEFDLRKENNDPPTYPRCLYNVLGEALLELGSPIPALSAFEKGLASLPNNGYSWSGIARAEHALGHIEKATQAYGRMRHTWSQVENDVWQARAADALGLNAEPEDSSPESQRNYSTVTLSTLGPNTWQPYVAPSIHAKDRTGKTVSLEDLKGQNILLIFYLSDQCIHCVEQLKLVQDRISEFESRNTTVIAISSDPPEKNAKGDIGALPFNVLSDDAFHQNAIRFKSYDEFEEIELHSTHLIDARGRIRWTRSGGDPFTDIDFLIGELDRMKTIDRQKRLDALSSGAG